MKYDRYKFRELNKIYDEALGYNGSLSEEGEKRLNNKLKEWSLNELKEERDFYKDKWAPSWAFNAWLDYYIKSKEEEETNKEANYVDYLLQSKDLWG